MRVDINPKQLKVFYYVSLTLSFAKAAQKLFVTQPAVRMQVDALENMCRTKLLSREGRNLSLTKTGRELFEYSKQLVETLHKAEQTVMDSRAHPRGILRMGTSKTWARYLMPNYILRFRRLYPDIDICLEEGNSHEMANKVLRGENDLAIIGRVPYDARLETISFPGQHADELVLVAHPEHRLAKKKTINVNDLCDEPLILQVKGSGTRTVLDNYFGTKGIFPKALLEADSSPFIADLVKQNEGISVLTYLCVEEDERQGRLAAVSFEDMGLWLNIDIVHKQVGCISDVTHHFLDFLNDNGEDLLLGAQMAM